MTEFEKGYEQGYKDGVAGAALSNVNDNGDKIDGYSYAYKTDSRGEPYIHIDSVRSMLKKAADVIIRTEVLELIESFKVESTHKLSKSDFDRNDTLRLLQDVIRGVTRKDVL